jgi:hypothetical protein
LQSKAQELSDLAFRFLPGPELDGMLYVLDVIDAAMTADPVRRSLSAQESLKWFKDVLEGIGVGESAKAAIETAAAAHVQKLTGRQGGLEAAKKRKSAQMAQYTWDLVCKQRLQDSPATRAASKIVHEVLRYARTIGYDFRSRTDDGQLRTIEQWILDRKSK